MEASQFGAAAQNPGEPVDQAQDHVAAIAAKDAELEALRAQLEQASAPAQNADELAAKDAELARLRAQLEANNAPTRPSAEDYDGDWPAPGAPPLWELAASHADNAIATKLGKPMHQVSRRDRDEHPADLGPHTISHHRPTLTTGSAGVDVVELGRLLAANGHTTNSLNDGTNHASVLDASVMADVRRFMAENGVGNDPGEFVGREQPPEVYVGTHVGPYVWEALYRKADAAAAA
jgi:murein L,D-transpeptidase YcbB/YkuD